MWEIEDQQDNLDVNKKCFLSKSKFKNGVIEEIGINLMHNNNSLNIIPKLIEIPLPVFSGEIEKFSSV